MGNYSTKSQVIKITVCSSVQSHVTLSNNPIPDDEHRNIYHDTVMKVEDEVVESVDSYLYLGPELKLGLDSQIAVSVNGSYKME